jgi:hypothetical protein
MDRDEISTLYRGPPIDTSYQVAVHLAKRFQRRRILKETGKKNQYTSTFRNFVANLPVSAILV